MGGLPRAKTRTHHQGVSNLSLHTSACLCLTRPSSTELECSIKGYRGAIFQSCSSDTEAKIRFDIFTERISKMFAGPDPFPKVEALMSKLEEADELQQTPPPVEPKTPVRVTPELPLASQGPKPSTTTSNVDDVNVNQSDKPSILRNGDGWYVAHCAILPGTYYGV